MKYFEFCQNNSGGSFDVDEKLCHRLIIQAETELTAIEKVQDMGVYFDGCEKGIDCDCCGDRWYEPSEVDIKRSANAYKKKFKNIEQYAQHMANEYGWTYPDVRIFYANGAMTEIFKQQKSITHD